MKARKGPLLALMSALLAATSASRASAWENPLEHPAAAPLISVSIAPPVYAFHSVGLVRSLG
jgi:hypothetical protein